MKQSVNNTLVRLLLGIGILLTLAGCQARKKTAIPPAEPTPAVAPAEEPAEAPAPIVAEPEPVIEPVVEPKPEPVVNPTSRYLPEIPVHSSWHTAELWPIQTSLILSGGQIISANCKAQCVHDSLTILSLMPIIGVEIMRVEARPDSVFAIDRLRRRIAADSYTHLSEMLGEPVSLRVVEVIATGEILPEGQKTFEAETMGIRLNLRYPTIKRDGALRLKQIDHRSFTPCSFYDLLY